MMQAVQVIIERLKTNPEEFFGDLDGERLIGRYSPRFDDIREKLDDLLIEKPDAGHVHRLWYLEPEEKAALLAAYKEARRARFEARTFHQLLTRQEKEERSTVTYKAQGRYSSSSNIIAPQKIINESLELLNKEFDKQYAKNSDPRS
jgi:hypothetical protein